MQLDSEPEPILLSPYHVEPFPLTLDLARDLHVFGISVPDTRMRYYDDVCTVRHFLGAWSDDEHGYLGFYRCSRTVFAQPKHVVCTSDKLNMPNIACALYSETIADGAAFDFDLCGYWKTKAGCERYSRMDRPLGEPPTSEWTAPLHVGSRAMLLGPDFGDVSDDVFTVKAICPCGECVELEHLQLRT